MAKKWLVFLDIDGTLIDVKYQLNDKTLPDTIEKLQKTNKVTFVLNSNRSLHDILAVAKQFKIKGPVICENGLFVYFQDSKKIVYLASKKHLKNLKRVKRKVRTWIEKASSTTGAKTHYTKTDTVTLINENKAINLASNSIFVFDNIFRKYTVSAHIKRKEGNHFTKDLVYLKQLQKEFANNIKGISLSKEIRVGFSESFGNLLIYSKIKDKRSAVDNLVKKFYSNNNIVAIGDELSDYEMVNGLGEFWTVGSSKSNIKARATIVSSKEYAKGVSDLLKSKITI